MNTSQRDYTILAVDYGNARVGLALAHSIARIPNPLAAFPAGNALIEGITKVIADNNVQQIVVGMPYAPMGGDTEQTKIVRDFVAVLSDSVTVPVETIDESMSSVEAERLLKGKPVDKGMVDAYAAAIILQRYLDEHRGDF